VPVLLFVAVYAGEFIAHSARVPPHRVWPFNLILLLAGMVWLVVLSVRDPLPVKPFLRGLITGASFALAQTIHWTTSAYVAQQSSSVTMSGVQVLLFFAANVLLLSAIVGLIVGGIVAGVVRLVAKRAGP
jgi:predicted DNA repair protein MutK